MLFLVAVELSLPAAGTTVGSATQTLGPVRSASAPSLGTALFRSTWSSGSFLPGGLTVPSASTVPSAASDQPDLVLGLEVVGERGRGVVGLDLLAPGLVRGGEGQLPPEPLKAQDPAREHELLGDGVGGAVAALASDRGGGVPRVGGALGVPQPHAGLQSSSRAPGVPQPHAGLQSSSRAAKTVRSRNVGMGAGCTGAPSSPRAAGGVARDRTHLLDKQRDRLLDDQATEPLEPLLAVRERPSLATTTRSVSDAAAAVVEGPWGPTELVPRPPLALVVQPKGHRPADRNPFCY